jgi:(2Fe-2S) ferredoxin
VVIYPQGIWYGNVQLADVSRIIDETIVGGKVLDDLLIADELLNTKGGTIRPTSCHDPSAETEAK